MVKIYKYTFAEGPWFYVVMDDVMFGLTAHAGLKTIIRSIVPQWALDQAQESNPLEMLVQLGVTEQDIQQAQESLKKEGDRIIIDKEKVIKMWDCETDELKEL